MNVIEKVNGYKTIIGIASLIIGYSPLVNYLTPEEATAIIDAGILAFGAVMTVVGLIHKIIKRNQ